jgi:hypothetical protein
MDVTFDVDGAGRVAVKFQADGWEVNFRASGDELMALGGVRSFDWNERRSVRAGSRLAHRCSGRPMATKPRS